MLDGKEWLNAIEADELARAYPAGTAIAVFRDPANPAMSSLGSANAPSWTGMILYFIAAGLFLFCAVFSDKAYGIISLLLPMRGRG